MNSPSQTIKLPHLDKLRGFAAISVLVSHVIVLTDWHLFPNSGIHTWWRMGWAGVDIFFVISGLVIFLSAASLMEKKPDWRKHFFIRRFYRIAPLYYLTGGVFLLFLVAPVFVSWGSKEKLFQLTTHLLFIHNIFQDTHGSINGPNWSIGVEMQFYVLMLWLTPLLIKTKRPFIVFLSLLLIPIIYRAATFFLLQEKGFTPIFQKSTQLPGTLDGFGFGILLGWLFLFKNRLFKSKKLIALSLITSALVFYFSCLFIFAMGGDYWSSVGTVSLFKTVFSFSIFCFIFFIISMPSLPYFLDSFLDYFGKISYGIYLWHLPIILVLKTTTLAQPGFHFLWFTCLLTFSCAAFTYHFLENPWIDKAQRYGKKIDQGVSVAKG